MQTDLWSLLLSRFEGGVKSPARGPPVWPEYVVTVPRGIISVRRLEMRQKSAFFGVLTPTITVTVIEEGEEEEERACENVTKGALLELRKSGEI